jgi:hypothetical protein
LKSNRKETAQQTLVTQLKQTGGLSLLAPLGIITKTKKPCKLLSAKFIANSVIAVEFLSKREESDLMIYNKDNLPPINMDSLLKLERVIGCTLPKDFWIWMSSTLKSQQLVINISLTRTGFGGVTKEPHGGTRK